MIANCGRMNWAEIFGHIGMLDRLFAAVVIGAGICAGAITGNLQTNPSAVLLAILALGILYLLARIDLETFRLPDRLMVLLFAALSLHALTMSDPGQRFIAALVLGVLFLVFGHVMSRVLKRPAFGAGDVKLIAAGALVIPIEYSADWLLVSAISALLWVLFRRMWRGRTELKIPFGPFIAWPIAAYLLLGVVR